MFSDFLNPVLLPLLDLGYFWAIFILSFIITGLITIVYKYATDQSLMKSLKKEMKELQKEAKKNRSNTSKAMEINKKLMDKNMKYMKHSFKPTLYTFIPIIIIFGWLNSHLAFYPIAADEPFKVSAVFEEGTFGNASLEVIPEGVEIIGDPTKEISESAMVNWSLKGDPGQYQLLINFNSKQYKADLVVADESYAPPQQPVSDSQLDEIQIHNKKVAPLQEIGIGWSINWIWTYILLSLLFSFSLRKLLKIS